jgi:cysteine desulfurase
MSPAGKPTLDLRGLLCPQPIIDLAREMGKIDVGEDIVILSDDAAFPLDLRAWCAGTGHELLDLASAGPDHRARIRKSGRG